MICQPTSATSIADKHAFAQVYHQQIEECFLKLENIFARVALETYAKSKTGQQHNHQEIRRLYVLSPIHHTWEQVAICPANLQSYIDAHLNTKLSTLPTDRKEFFNCLLEKTVEKMQCQTKATLAHLICECEFGPQHKFVNLKQSKIVRTIVLQATDRFFAKAKL